MIGRIISHYQMLERLGGGGMGVVYKAKDLRLDRAVALKFLSGERSESDEDRRRFQREARAASALDHPNICGLYDIGESEEGRLYLAMAYCEGETLKGRMARGPLPPGEAADIAAQIADGLAAAHGKGITHRDIKPANVIIAIGGRVKIVDFGLAGLADQTRLTRPGIAIGTASYMSPEQCRGEAADPATDIWALGVVLYEMVSSRLPFPGERPEQVIQAILKRRPEPLPDLPAELTHIVLRALAKDPADRYPNAEALAADLASFRASHDPSWGRTLTDVSVSPLWNPPGSAARSAPSAPSVGLVGRTVSHYRIGQLLGGGGMGVVYRAEDLRLERTVALKFLPPELSFEPEAKERFLKEARAASALDHPNVCTIHEVGETEDGRLFLAMPCYQGETLRERIARGPLPVDEALDYARQIARGLIKAHRQGIVHRDIKPANLLITDDGVVKILDFGLAKLAGAAAVTRVGSSIGTPAYMSPEQARGEAVDARTDLWSLGVVLYEMLAGRKPFKGEHEQAIIYALLNESPEPIAKLRPEIPEGLPRFLDRLLAKEQNARLDSADAVLAELKVLSGITLGATGLQTAAAPSAPHRTGAARRSARWWWIAAAVAVLALGGLAWLAFAHRRLPPPRVTAFERLTYQGGRALFPSLSPDGETVVYSREEGRDLDIFWQRAIGGSNPNNLTAAFPGDDSQAAWSPNGSEIAFRSEREGGGIFIMGATGESPRRVTDFGFNPAWSPDGNELVVATEGVSNPTARYTRSELYRVPARGSGSRRLVTQGDAVQPSWSPHGQRIAYWGLMPGSSRRAIYTVAAAGGEPVLALADEHVSWNPVWSPEGDSLYFLSDRGGAMNLWRVAIDESSGEVRGEPEPLTTPAGAISFLSLSKDGHRLAFAVNESRATLESAAFDPATLAVSGALEPVLGNTRGVRAADVSPDGRFIAYQSAAPREDLFVFDRQTAVERQLTDDDARDRHPHWSPDGAELAFYSDREKAYEIWTIRADGSGLARAVAARSGVINTFPLWAPAGRRLIFTEGDGSPMELDLGVPAERRKAVSLPLAGPRVDFAPTSWSADGTALAGDLERPGKADTCPGIYSFATHTYTAVAERGRLPVWMRDGRHLLYLDGGQVYAVDVATKQSRLALRPPAGASFTSVSLDPGNRSLYLVVEANEGEIGMVTLERR